MTWLLVPLSAAVLAHYLVVTRSLGLLTLDGLFPLAHWVMSAGTLVLLDPVYHPDATYAYVMTLPVVTYCVTSIIMFLLSRRTPVEAAPELKAGGLCVAATSPGVLVWVLLAVSSLVAVAYFVGVGYNVFLVGLQGLLSGSTDDYTSMRLNSYSGDRYFFPGYVNQFKNVLLPALSVVVVHHLYSTRSPVRHVVAGVLSAGATVGLLGTGQRGAFVLFVLTLVTYLYWQNRSRFRARMVPIAGAALPLLAVTSLFLGRGDTTTAATGTSRVGEILGQIGERFWHDNQESGQRAFWYTMQLPTQHGAEWLAGATAILPGKSGSSLARDVFQQTYGSDRGTSPPSLWGSVHYNFGMTGVFVAAAVFAICAHLVTTRALWHRAITSLEAVGMSGVFAVAGAWIAGGPEYLLNAGGVTFFVLWLIGRRYSRRMRRALTAPAAPLPAGEALEPVVVGGPQRRSVS